MGAPPPLPTLLGGLLEAAHPQPTSCPLDVTGLTDSTAVSQKTKGKIRNSKKKG